MRTKMHGVGALTVSALLLMMLPAHAQITYLREPPTVEQLQQMLGAPRAGATLRSRGVVWEGGQPPAAAALPAKGAQGSQGTQATQGAPAGAPASSAQLEAAAGSDPGAGPAVAMPISFDAGSARVSRPSIAYVDVVAQLLAKEPSLRLTIEGHTDASGNAQRNLVLSWDRALAVYRVLVERYGIDGRRLQPLGRGSQDPLEGLPVESPMNRRVQFRVAA